jgi:hypothetical protein
MTTLTPAQEARKAQAITAAGQIFADAMADMADLYMTGGAAAVADAAYVNGGPSREVLAERYEALAEIERAKRDARAASAA